MMNSRLVKTLKLCLMVLLFNSFYSFLENLIGNQQTEFDQNSSENDQQYILKRNLIREKAVNIIVDYGCFQPQE